MYTVVGFTGYAQVGKDKAAEVLVREFGYRRISFADVLRKMLYELNPIVNATPMGFGACYLRVQTLVNTFGWDEAKRHDEVRALLQRLGTECGRNILGPDIWVNTAFKDVKPGERVVVTDVRFENEAKAVFVREGILIRIERPGVGPVNGHASEKAIDERWINGVISNDGTEEELHRQVIAVANGSLQG